MKVPTIVAAGAVLAGVTLSAAQLVVPGRSGTLTPARLSPTAHPPVPDDLASMWLVPQQTAKPGPAMTNFVRGVRLLEEDDRAAEALPLVSDGALSTTPVADYARYYTGLALMKLSRYAEADKVLADLASRPIDGHLPEDAAFRLAEVREVAEGLQGRRQRLRIAGPEETGPAPRGLAASWACRRSGRATDAIGRSVAARLLRFPDDGGVGPGGRGAGQTGRRPRGAVRSQGTGARGDAVPGAAMDGGEGLVRSREIIRGRRRSRPRGDQDCGGRDRASAAIAKAARRCGPICPGRSPTKRIFIPSPRHAA